MSKLTGYEIDILRSMTGEDVPGVMWGAAMGECVENLYAGGYVNREHAAGCIRYVITDKGREAITAPERTADE
jgi:hypothetical protein